MGLWTEQGSVLRVPGWRADCEQLEDWAQARSMMVDSHRKKKLFPRAERCDVDEEDEEGQGSCEAVEPKGELE